MQSEVYNVFALDWFGRCCFCRCFARALADGDEEVGAAQLGSFLGAVLVYRNVFVATNRRSFRVSRSV